MRTYNRALLAAAVVAAAVACASAPEPNEGESTKALEAASGTAPDGGAVVSAPGTGTGPGVPLKSFLPPGVAMAEAKAPSAFGAPLTAGLAAVQIADVLKDPDGFAGKTVLVEAKVRQACQKKGCWMELAASTDKGTPGCRVTFKNYGFFVPKDSAGSDARVEGTVEVKAVAKSEVDHLEAEGASFTKGADGSAREVRIVATGVELRK